MQLYLMQQKIKDAIIANWKFQQPCVIQAGMRSGKTVIVESILGESFIQSPLVISANYNIAKKAFQNIAHLEILSPKEFLDFAYYNRDSEDQFDIDSTIILDDPWWWQTTDSEKIYRLACDYSNKVLAIGVYNPNDVWSFDAIIPKYTTEEINPHFSINDLHLYDQKRAKLTFGRNF